MTISCIISESKIAIFHTSLLHNNPSGKRVANIFALFFSQPSQMPTGGTNKFCKQFSIYSFPASHRLRETSEQTDRQTDGKAVSEAQRLLCYYTTFIKNLSYLLKKPTLNKDKLPNYRPSLTFLSYPT